MEFEIGKFSEFFDKTPDWFKKTEELRYTSLFMNRMLSKIQGGQIPSIHEWLHVRNVWHYAQKYMVEYPITNRERKNLKIACFLHDSCRIDDDYDKWHAENGAQVAANLVPIIWPEADCGKITHAIANHNNPKIDKVLDIEKIVSYLLSDSDKSDLLRIAYFADTTREIREKYGFIDPRMLYTKSAKGFVNTGAHHQVYSKYSQLTPAALDSFLDGDKLKKAQVYDSIEVLVPRNLKVFS